LEGVEGSPQILASSELLLGRHWLEVEGVVVEFMEGFP